MDAGSFIDPVTGDDLAAAVSRGIRDKGGEALVAAETPYIDARRAQHKLATSPCRTALALSGGGIRSAAFGLGVMQRLAAAQQLHRFDYLSTVSGGGYIGAALSWFTSKPFTEKTGVRFGTGGDTARPFPYGVDDPITGSRPHPPNPADHLLTYLRSHGQYLMPGGGITLVSGIAVVLRGIFLNLVVWFPIAVTLAALLRYPFFGHWRDTAIGNHLPGWILDLPGGFALIFLFGAVLWSIMALGALWYSIRAYARRSPEATRYRLRRRQEAAAHWLLLFAVGLTLVGTLPMVAGALEMHISENGGLMAFLAGIAGGIWSFVKTKSDDQGAIPTAVVAPVAGILFLYGFAILAYDAAGGAIACLVGIGPVAAVASLVLLSVPSIAIGYFTNLNYLTLHRFYRDRLMEAFMPDMKSAEANEAGAALHADPVALSKMCDEAAPFGPYHLVNTNLILTGSPDKTRRARGGDSFLLSPRYCGSNATGWQRTTEFLGDGMTLPTAMAISGAAANPNTGSGGVGLSRNPIVSIVMSLFNVRLGYWIANPRWPDWSKFRPNHFHPGLVEMFDRNSDEESWSLRLSDGGHFDNLGLYELIRRRVKFILVSDAGADPTYSFNDLTTLIARARQDFGALITFEETPALKSLMNSVALVFPKDRHRSDKGYAVAAIKYPGDAEPGMLVYVTTALIDQLDLPLLGYFGANPDFPDETTADQFFSEEQFDAYRKLGWAVTAQMLTESRLTDALAACAPPAI